MPGYDVFFFGAAFFLGGVFLMSLGLSFPLILAVTLLAAALATVFWVFKKNRRLLWLAGLSVFVIIGAYYFILDNRRFQDINIAFGQNIVFKGKVAAAPEYKSASQEFKVELFSPWRGNIIAKTPPYPRFHYGDIIEFQGLIKKPEPKSYADYLAKDRISGISLFPEAKLIAQNQGSFLKSRLIGLKDKILGAFQNILPQEEAAFLGGLTLGSRSEFSKEFKEALSLSGTTHLVALSGYNITIIGSLIAGLFAYFFSRRTTFVLTVFAVLGFVVMTGGEASVVRAAIMGILALFAKEIGRVFDFRNAIILAALAMVVFNPKLLAFDIGFQLSFLALLGIIYLRPAIQKIFKISEETGFLGWRENFLTTLSAQMAVVPLLISNFGRFSITSLLANVIVLEFIPVTMGLGFLTAGLYFLSYYLAAILSWAVWLLLKFEIIAINLFAHASIPFSPSLSAGLILVYYSAIVFIIVYARNTNKIQQK